MSSKSSARARRQHNTRRWHINLAAHVLTRGGVVAYPTEAVFGLGCEPMNEAAVDRILAMKHRDICKGFILVAADFKQLQPFVLPLHSATLNKVMATWPGPTTWLMPASPHVPWYISGSHYSIAVRVSDHPVVAALCRRFGGAIVSTSANPSGAPAARTALRVRKYFNAELDFILPGSLGNAARPTAIKDALSGSVIRAG